MLSEGKPSSLDCIAVSYLALALTPQVPQKWLAETMIARYPELCAYVKRFTEESFGGPVELGDALIGFEEDCKAVRDSHTVRGQNSTKLQWRAPAQKGVREAGSALLTRTFSALPLVQHFSRDKILLDHGRASKSTRGSTELSTNHQSLIIPSLLALGSVIAAIGGYFLYFDIFDPPTHQKKNLSEMGDAGAMLGMGLFGGYEASSMGERRREGRIPVGLEVDVEVDEATAT